MTTNTRRADPIPVAEPPPDAPVSEWRQYFNSQIQMLNQDLAHEPTSLGNELNKFAGRKAKSDRARQQERFNRRYLAELPPPDSGPIARAVAREMATPRPTAVASVKRQIFKLKKARFPNWTAWEGRDRTRWRRMRIEDDDETL